jgi:hypothetical protein
MKKPTYYVFTNKDGQSMHLRGDLTMEDLIRMGYRDIRLVLPETPIGPCEWRHTDNQPYDAKKHQAAYP